MVRFLFNIYFFKDALVYKFKYQWCAWFFHVLYHTKSSISAIFRTHPTLVSPSPVLSTPQWETSISSCLPRSQYISLFSVFIANITGLFNLINFLNFNELFKNCSITHSNIIKQILSTKEYSGEITPSYP